MYQGDDSLGSAVAVGVAGPNLFIAPHEHVVHTPGVDRQALNLGVFFLRDRNSLLYMPDQSIDVPGQMPV